MNPIPAWAVISFVVLHFGAIVCAWGTRVAVGSRFELASQSLFLTALVAVGMATWHGHAAATGLGIPSGVTLIAMVLLAVIDFRRTHEPRHRHRLAMQR